MKALRFIFYLLMPVFLVAGMYTGMRLWYVLLIFQFLIIFIILAMDIWTVRTFSYKQTLDELTAVKGSETMLHLSVINEKPFPLSLMRVNVEMVSPRENVLLTFGLLPYADRDFELKVAMPYRGVYPIGISTIQITDIFGLLPLRFDMRKLPYYRQPELTVYPRAELPASVYADVADEKLFGDRYLHAAESGSSVSGARPYRPGDPLKQIHWKKSAQHGGLFVRQYDHPVREGLTVVIDNCSFGLSGDEALAAADTVCEAAACITLHCLSKSRSANLFAACDTKGVRSFEEAFGMDDFDRVHQWLAVIPFSEKEAENLIPSAPAGTASGSLIFITAQLSENAEAELAAMQQFFSSVTLVLVSEAQEYNGDIFTLRLRPGCSVADELTALE